MSTTQLIALAVVLLVAAVVLAIVLFHRSSRRCPCGHKAYLHKGEAARCASKYARNAAGVNVRRACPCPGWDVMHRTHPTVTPHVPAP